MLASDELRPFLARMLEWSDERRVELAARQIRLAWDVLDAKGWLKPTSPSGSGT
jgi:hypothetical protein